MTFSTSDFFHESGSPQPQSIPLGPFQIFSKIRERSLRRITGIVDTGGKLKKSYYLKIKKKKILHL
jgi:hypothetical protein